jgi:hypothetical protein
VQHISVLTAFLVSVRALQNSWQPVSKGLTVATIRGWYDNINTELEQQDGRVWNGLIWLVMGTNGGLF